MFNVEIKSKNADLVSNNNFSLFIYDEENNLILSEKFTNCFNACLKQGLYLIKVGNSKGVFYYKVITVNTNLKVSFIFNLPYICSRKTFKNLTRIFLTDQFYQGLKVEKGMIIFE